MEKVLLSTLCISTVVYGVASALAIHKHLPQAGRLQGIEAYYFSPESQATHAKLRITQIWVAVRHAKFKRISINSYRRKAIVL